MGAYISKEQKSKNPYPTGLHINTKEITNFAELNQETISLEKDTLEAHRASIRTTHKNRQDSPTPRDLKEKITQHR